MNKTLIKIAPILNEVNMHRDFPTTEIFSISEALFSKKILRPKGDT